MSNTLNTNLKEKLDQLKPFYKWINESDIAAYIAPILCVATFFVYVVYKGISKTSFDWFELFAWVACLASVIYLMTSANNRLLVDTEVLEDVLDYAWSHDARILINKAIAKNKELRLGELSSILEIQYDYLQKEMAKNEKIYRDSLLDKLAATPAD